MKAFLFLYFFVQCVRSIFFPLEERIYSNEDSCRTLAYTNNIRRLRVPTPGCPATRYTCDSAVLKPLAVGCRKIYYDCECSDDDGGYDDYTDYRRIARKSIEQCTCSKCSCIYSQTFIQNQCTVLNTSERVGGYIKFGNCGGAVADTPIIIILVYCGLIILAIIAAIVYAIYKMYKCKDDYTFPSDYVECCKCCFNPIRAIKESWEAVFGPFLKEWCSDILVFIKDSEGVGRWAVITFGGLACIPLGLAAIFVLVGIIQTALKNYTTWPWISSMILAAVTFGIFFFGITAFLYYHFIKMATQCLYEISIGLLEFESNKSNDEGKIPKKPEKPKTEVEMEEKNTISQEGQYTPEDDLYDTFETKEEIQPPVDGYSSQESFQSNSTQPNYNAPPVSEASGSNSSHGLNLPPNVSGMYYPEDAVDINSIQPVYNPNTDFQQNIDQNVKDF